MGRKSKAALLGLIERICYLHDKQHKTYQEIEEALRSEGIDISREAIRLSYKNAGEAAKEYKVAYEEARAIIDTVRDNPGTDTIEAITAILTSKMLASVKNIDEINVTNPDQISKMVKSLSDSQVKIGKLRLEHHKGYEAAKRDFISQLNEELKEHPQLLKQLIKIIEAMNVKDE